MSIRISEVTPFNAVTILVLITDELEFGEDVVCVDKVMTLLNAPILTLLNIAVDSTTADESFTTPGVRGESALIVIVGAPVIG